MAVVTLDPQWVSDLNIIACDYDARTGQATFQLRIRDKDGFLAVTTLKHYADSNLKDIVELWRQQNLMFPALALLLEFPQWDDRTISGSYLSVETTPIVKLLMGKAMYGDVRHIWFREILQNALDAASTRSALEGDEYTSEITIRFDGDKTVTIADNGIGMTYQHILRYLTTLGRSIWRSEELESGDSKVVSRTVGKFGIGFVSVFQEAERVYVRTRFFRDVGEEGWLVDFASVEKPFFTERSSFAVGTEVEVQLKSPLATRSFGSLLEGFFLYINENVVVTPSMQLPRTLSEVVPVPADKLKRGSYWDKTTQEQIGENRFALRTMFCYWYKKRDRDDSPPASTLEICNAGVKVFRQTSLFLRPGRRYVWIREEDEDKPYSRWRDDRDVLKHFAVILDFDKGFSPVLPSRLEIDIERGFSEELRTIIHERFCEGLEENVNNLDVAEKTPKEKRAKMLECLTFSVSESNRGWYGGDRRPREFCDDEVIQRRAIDLYVERCPVAVVDHERNESYCSVADLLTRVPGYFVHADLSETALFKVYVRAKGIGEWVQAASRREFFLLQSVLGEHGWKGLFEDRDIYKERSELFIEKIDSPLAPFVRGDYAVIQSDVFGSAGIMVLPANLPGSWKRSDAARSTRDHVSRDCPVRVLLNSTHGLVASLEEFLCDLDAKPAMQVRLLRVLLDDLADGVIEQERVTVARERWLAIRDQISEILGVNLSHISYESLIGK